MARRPPSSRIVARNETTDLMGVLHGMMESQQEQTAFLRDGLVVVQQTATVAMEKATAPQEPRAGNISDFRRLQPTIFGGTEKPLDAEQ